ncbi:hypothetical protein F5Y13DRAFT_62847 [Hypoxylon sp. FL1857]|nr:hypothetical protein F5Y13DRAFT_62847 [Hypoxylon sp. FL1857]
MICFTPFAEACREGSEPQLILGDRNRAWATASANQRIRFLKFCRNTSGSSKEAPLRPFLHWFRQCADLSQKCWCLAYRRPLVLSLPAIGQGLQGFTAAIRSGIFRPKFSPTHTEVYYPIINIDFRNMSGAVFQISCNQEPYQFASYYLAALAVE